VYNQGGIGIIKSQETKFDENVSAISRYKGYIEGFEALINDAGKNIAEKLAVEPEINPDLANVLDTCRKSWKGKVTDENGNKTSTNIEMFERVLQGLESMKGRSWLTRVEVTLPYKRPYYHALEFLEKAFANLEFKCYNGDEIINFILILNNTFVNVLRRIQARKEAAAAEDCEKLSLLKFLFEDLISRYTLSHNPKVARLHDLVIKLFAPVDTMMRSGFVNLSHAAKQGLDVQALDIDPEIVSSVRTRINNMTATGLTFDDRVEVATITHAHRLITGKENYTLREALIMVYEVYLACCFCYLVKMGYLSKDDYFAFGPYEYALDPKKRGKGKSSVGHFRPCADYLEFAMTRSNVDGEKVEELFEDSKNSRVLTVSEFVDETFRCEGSFYSKSKGILLTLYILYIHHYCCF
jgi:hypothetical protein